MHQSILKGGLKITHVNTQVLASHIKWVQRLFRNSKAKLIIIFQLFIFDIEIKDPFLSRCHIDTTEYNLTLF